MFLNPLCKLSDIKSKIDKQITIPSYNLDLMF